MEVRWWRRPPAVGIAISETCRQRDLTDPVTLLIATGLRGVELLALRWSDFGADAGTMSVYGKVIRRRVIPLPAFAIATLTERRNLPFLGEQSVIFPSTSGTLRDPDNFAGQWRKTRDELGVPDISSHSFRKTVATLIGDAGLSARVGADHLGHAKVSMTQDRYMSRGRVHSQVAELLDKAVNDNSGPL